MTAQHGFEKVVIVGAGPSGLLLALLLAKAGIPVHIVEAEDHLNDQPRAAHYGPAAIPDLQRAGIIDEIRKRGINVHGMCWRRFEDHSYIAGFDGSVLKDVQGDIRTACLVLQDLVRLMLDVFLTKYNGHISWQHKVVSLGQDEDKAWVECETPEGKKTVSGDYIVGCDGANSAVRKGLFGDEFPGYTWERQIVATNTYYDFDKFGWEDANFIIHPQHFFMAAKIQDDGLWRVTYGEEPGLSREQLLERQPWKFETFLPGHPKADSGAYKIINFAPYKMHQRCCSSFRVGRFMLAADACHLVNPWGGMGITGGFVDAGGLYDCLYGIWTGQADESILDLYSEKRIEKWKTILDPVSTDNFQRVHDADPDTRLGRDPFLQMCQKVKGTPEEKEFLQGSLAIRYDFTQHYKSAPANTNGENGTKHGEVVPQPVG